MKIAIVTMMLTLLSVSACAEPGAYSTSPTGGKQLELEPVIHLGEETGDEVGRITLSEPLIFVTEDEWSAWYDETLSDELRDLPEGMREPTFDNAVAIAGSYHRCVEYSYLSFDSGEITFHITRPEDEENVDCSWAPNQVVVYDVPLNELGVDSSDAVSVNSDYVKDHITPGG